MLRVLLAPVIAVSSCTKSVLFKATSVFEGVEHDCCRRSCR